MKGEMKMALLKIVNPELKAKLIKDMKTYPCTYDNDYIAELGWADWMNEYTEAEDGEPASEAETDRINEFLYECWKEAHAEVAEDTLIRPYGEKGYKKVWKMAEDNCAVNGWEIKEKNSYGYRDGYIQYNGKLYALLEQAYPDADNTFVAPAVRLGDKIDSKMEYTCPRYRIVWSIKDDFVMTDDCDESEACDWEHPDEVIKTGEYTF